MATLKTIRKRITSVKNTQKITKAMKMVAAAKLRRAQSAVSAVRPYADGMKEILVSVSNRNREMEDRFFQSPPDRGLKAHLLVFTSNRGLCGGFNSNLLRKCETYLKGAQTKYDLFAVSVIGKKGRDFFKARRREVVEVYQEYAEKFPLEETQKLAQKWLDSFREGTTDEFYIAYNHFKSALSQEVRIVRLIPFDMGEASGQSPTKELVMKRGSGLASPSESEGGMGEASGQSPISIDFIYEPSQKELIDGLIPRFVAAELYRAHRESLASELGARMTAMENATNNAKEMIRFLTLQYNRVRQAAITKELMDIVNGAEAIK